jgi:hypothetical protein
MSRTLVSRTLAVVAIALFAVATVPFVLTRTRTLLGALGAHDHAVHVGEAELLPMYCAASPGGASLRAAGAAECWKSFAALPVADVCS